MLPPPPAAAFCLAAPISPELVSSSYSSHRHIDLQSPVKCDSATSSKAPTPVPNGFYRGILSFVCGYDTARLLEYSTIDTRTIFPSCQCPIQVASSSLYWFPVSTSIFSSLTTTENEPASVLSTEIACILWFKYKLKERLNTNYFYVLFIHYLDVLF